MQSVDPGQGQQRGGEFDQTPKKWYLPRGPKALWWQLCNLVQGRE